MDLITLEVLRHKFDMIADEMEIAILKSAYSSIVKEGMDASSALFTIGGETIAQAASIPIHLGSLVPAVGIVSKPVQKLVGKLTLFQGISQGLSHRKTT